jgi:hypothetical protein
MIFIYSNWIPTRLQWSVNLCKNRKNRTLVFKIAAAFYFGFASDSIQRRFLISNVSRGNMLAGELRIELACVRQTLGFCQGRNISQCKTELMFNIASRTVTNKLQYKHLLKPFR